LWFFLEKKLALFWVGSQAEIQGNGLFALSSLNGVFFFGLDMGGGGILNDPLGA
jgi:hypothetical protein